MKKKINFENLDAIRFFCFLSVFFFHSFHTEVSAIKENSFYQFIKIDVFGNGNIGVNFFFVLSGFLITYLLIEEKKINGQINLLYFWFRRILRIWPLFYACVFFGFYIFPILKEAFGQTSNESASIYYYIAFLSNFDLINKGLPDASVLGVLWSIAIEEQFYFAWPILLYIFPVRRYWILFMIIITLSIVFRGVYDNPIWHEYHTLSCMGDLAIGAMGAWLIHEKSGVKRWIADFRKYQLVLIYALFILIFFFRAEILQSNYYIRSIERSLVAIVAVFIILEQNYARNSFIKFSRFKFASKLGVISYGLYCLHFIGILVAITLTSKLGWNTKLWQVLTLETGLAFVGTVIISLVSFHFWEKPFLKLKRKFSYIRR